MQEGTDPVITGIDGGTTSEKNGWRMPPGFTAWAKMEPSIGLVDVRPYIYISKDKTLGFSLEAELGGELGQIVSDLISVSRALQMSAEKKTDRDVRAQRQTIIRILGISLRYSRLAKHTKRSCGFLKSCKI